MQELLQARPLLMIAQGVEKLNLTKPTVASALKNLHPLGIVREMTGKQRGRIFLYDAYLVILDEGTEPLPR